MMEDVQLNEENPTTVYSVKPYCKAYNQHVGEGWELKQIEGYRLRKTDDPLAIIEDFFSN